MASPVRVVMHSRMSGAPDEMGPGPSDESNAVRSLVRLIGAQEQERLLSFLVGQSRVLEMIACDEPLGATLAELVRVLERQAEGMLCSILLLSEDGTRVRHGAAPSLPASFNRTVDNQEIGPCAGSCGTAAFLRRQVIVTDIAQDPLWAHYRGAALAAGLRACWSTPILSRRAEVLGTFAIYYREPCAPAPLHVDLIALATHLAGVAIDRSATKQERLRLLGELELDRQALQNAGRHKDQFLAMLSHELRNPLSAIANAVSVMRLRLAQGQGLEDPLKVLERQLRNCSRMLDDLLDVARFSRGTVRLRREPVQLGDVITSAVETQRALVEHHGHELTVALPDRPLVVDGDPTRLEQVFVNLLSNAAKYSPDGSRILVAVERGPGEAVVRVRDNGFGIAPDLLPHVFDLFVQADRSLARSQGGLGLGLSLVRSLVEMHGGTVHASSRGVGAGSEFVVRLPTRAEPVQPAPPRAGRAPVAAAADAGARRILLVEDNLDAAETLAEALGMLGHEVEVVHDGPSALAAVAARTPELVLLDIGLPGMDGYEVARRIHLALEEDAPVLIALTGYGQEEDRERARAAGIDLHLTKPFDLSRLEELIREVRASSEASDRSARPSAPDASGGDARA